jgi:predicted phosphodiesterase
VAAPNRGAATPLYYRKLECLAWFKFTAIERCDEAELQKYSYRRVPEFFESGESRFLPYYDKIVYSAAELQDQNRTIWFVSTREDGDRENETRQAGGPTAPVLPFPRLYQQSPHRTLLWLSDVHFEPAGRSSHHAFPIENTEGRPNLATSVRNSVKGRLPSKKFEIGGVVVTGDLTWQAAPDEFESAYQLLEQVKEWGGIESGHVVVVPGNHDLAFTKTPAESGAEIKAVNPAYRRAFDDFSRRLFRTDPNKYLSMGRRLLLGDTPVEIVGLNSSHLQQAKGWFQGHGFLGRDQLDDAAGAMGWRPDDPGPRTAYRVVALHHHVVPIVYSDEPKAKYPYSVVLDSDRLVQWLVRYRVDIVMHGHMHQSALTRLAKPINRGRPGGQLWEFTVLAMGSAGAKIHAPAEERDNIFGLLDFEPTQMILTVLPVGSEGETDKWTAKIPRGRIVEAP